MVGVLGGVLGVVLGVLATWAWSTRHAQSLRDEIAAARSEVAVHATQLAQAHENLGRERTEHELALRNLEATFENLSNRVLAETVEHFNQSQEHVLRERDSKLDLTLKPLEALLEEYRRNLSEFDKEHTGALADVRNRATELLTAQLKTQEETRRLNQLLGRGDQRGHWGEVQLANVMERSGLRRTIDYDLQVSGLSDTGGTLRPDCVVKMPNGARIAVDAKFPFDRFESALGVEDVQQRRALYEEHARALRGHVKTLRSKSYWEVISPAPEFVVCFVPSDFAITAAFDADTTLHEYAAKERVLIVGPTNLLSLLWSVAMVVRQHDATVNAEQILQVAESIFDRIRLVAEPIAKMGKALDDGVQQYNKMVRSFEARLIPAAQSLRGTGGAARAKPLPQLGEVHEFTARLNEQKWGIGRGVGDWAEIQPVSKFYGRGSYSRSAPPTLRALEHRAYRDGAGSRLRPRRLARRPQRQRTAAQRESVLRRDGERVAHARERRGRAPRVSVEPRAVAESGGVRRPPRPDRPGVPPLVGRGAAVAPSGTRPSRQPGDRRGDRGEDQRLRGDRERGDHRAHAAAPQYERTTDESGARAGRPQPERRPVEPRALVAGQRAGSGAPRRPRLVGGAT